ncbi:MAG: hypothetical protein ACJ74K_12440 [Actinomycetes bacterium]
MVVGLARQPQRRPRSGQDQPVAVERQRLTGGRAPGRQPPAAVGQVDADDLGQDRLHPERSATQRRYRCQARWSGRGWPRSTQSARPPWPIS